MGRFFENRFLKIRKKHSSKLDECRRALVLGQVVSLKKDGALTGVVEVLDFFQGVFSRLGKGEGEALPGRFNDAVEDLAEDGPHFRIHGQVGAAKAVSPCKSGDLVNLGDVQAAKGVKKGRPHLPTLAVGDVVVELDQGVADHPGRFGQAVRGQHVAVPAHAPGPGIMLVGRRHGALDDQDALGVVQHGANDGTFRDVGLHLVHSPLKAWRGIDFLTVARPIEAVGADDPVLDAGISEGHGVVGVIAALGVASDKNFVVREGPADLVQVFGRDLLPFDFGGVVHDHVLVPADHGLVGSAEGYDDRGVIQAEGPSVELHGLRFGLHLVDPVQDLDSSIAGRARQQQELGLLFGIKWLLGVVLAVECLTDFF